ncbi:RHS repeat-associated core domain-containing protein [Streptomyces sp. NPDC007988]|uniref:RHS repeat-associated core domain-containing protein n=1 Tax=Streptomyces sp. NPDC007988 TaxID=3364802 RepID=UPI0036E9F9BB
MHGERFGVRLSTRWRSLTIGALVLALEAGTVSAQAAPTDPPPSPTASASMAPSPASPGPSLSGNVSSASSPAKKAGPDLPAAKAVAAAPTTSNAVYAYDAAGRLVGVTDPAGETARYRYDESGNRLGIDRFSSTRLSVLSLVPLRAPAGATVTLSGTGFATASAANSVAFGSKTAEVVSASATRLAVKVPQHAVNGKVSVTVGGTTVQSPEAFTLASPGPTIASVAPASGATGAEVTLTGMGFAPVLTDNVVRFGGGIVAEVTARTDTTVKVKVPGGAATGPIDVETRDGRAASSASFLVLSGNPNGDIESSEQTSVTDTSPPTVAVTTPGNRAQILFDADAGDDIGFGFTNSTFNGAVTLELYDPEGNKVGGNGSVSGAAGDWEVQGLPLNGTYSLILKPGTNNIGAATVTVSEPVPGALDRSGPTAEVQLARAGQDAHWSVTGTLGQALHVGIDATGMEGTSYVRLYDADGTQVASQFVGTVKVAALEVASLPKSGQFTVRFDPDKGATGTVKATASTYADAGVLDPEGPEASLAIARPGQSGIARFTAQAGERLSLGVSAAAFPSYITLQVRAPNGSAVGSSFTVPANSSAEWDSAALPATGTYTVVIDPQAVQTGNVKLTLSRPASIGQLSPTAAPAAVSLTRPGQNAEATFQADAGADVSLGITANTFPSTVYVSVLAPSGTTVADVSSSLTADTIGMTDLPETGTYRVVIDPYQGSSGTLALSLSSDVLTPLAADGPSVAATITRPGQRIRAEFTAPATTSLGLAATPNTMPQLTDIRLVPEGGTATFAGSFSKNEDDVVYITGLTAGKKYTLLLTPDYAATGSVTLWLSTPVTAALTPGAPSATPEITRPGQQLEFTHTAAAADGAAMLFTSTTLTASSTIQHLAPGAAQETFLGSLATANTDIGLRAPLPAGMHRVFVRPSAPVTGRTTATLIPDADGGTLTVGGGQRPVNLTTAGQHGHYTFTGTKNQRLTLAIATPPAAWYLSIYGPDGKWLVNDRSMSANTLTFALAALPVDGTYTLTVDPTAQNTGTYNLGLTTTAAGVATAPAAAKAAEPQTAASGSEAGTAGGVVPSGPDAWQPGKANLAGRDWITARGKAPKALVSLLAPPGATALTGRVLKLGGTPLAKVTVSVGEKSTRTDARGQFLLTGISPQATTVVVDGSSANTKSRQYGRFDIRIHPKAGQSVDLGFPVWMSALDTKHTVRFDAPAKTDVVLKTPKIPGLEVRIPKGSVVRDDKGRPVTELGITAIPLDRAPFPLPKSTVVPVYFTVQPGGTYVFPKGAQIIYPNYTREAPGTRVEFLDYDPKKKGWYVYGHGQVSADGRQVVPDAKTRVWAFHGAMFNTDTLPPWLTGWLKDVLDWLSGDPVELSTGMLTDSRTDLAVSDPRGSAEVTRTYWQGDTHKRAFGIGRDLIYNSFLHSQEQYKEVDLYLPGGAKVHYIRTSPGTTWNDAIFEPLNSPSEFKGSKIYGGNGRWELRFRDGSQWTYGQYAPLGEIRDRHGNIIKITRRNGSKGDITQITTPGGRWVSFTYDTEHRVTGARDNTGRTTSYTYDTAGRLDTVTDPAGKASRYAYDGTSNRIKTATDARGITYMTNTFDGNGRVKEQTLTEGQKYTFDYTQDGLGRVTSATVTQPGGSVRRVEFNVLGYGTKDTRAYGTSLARTTTYQRNATTNRIDAVVDPYGRRTKLTYDANGHITSTAELDGTPQARTSGTAVFDGPFDQPTRVTDPLGNATTLAYATDGDLDTVTDAEDRVTRLDFTPAGQIQKVTNAAGAVTEYTYRNGDLVSVRDAEGRVSGQFLDAAGRPTVLTDESGSATTVAYDKLNQPRSVTDPLGQTISLGYDDNGNLTTLTDARNNATTWAYDQADRPKTATDPLGVTAAFEYHPAGQIAKVTNRSGQVAMAAYDLLGRAETVKYGVDEIAGKAQSTATYAYDSVDLPKTLTDTEAGRQSFTYDAYDRLKTVTGPTGTVGYGYGYDAADRRREMTAAGTTTTYGYDKSSTLTSVTSGTQNVAFGLDAVGRQKTATLPGGITRTTGYDKTGITSTIAYTRGTATIGDLTYTRDARGLQTGLAGTLASIAIPAAETGSVFGKDNRLTTFNGRTFTYDNEGQLTNDGQNTYIWNTRGQLTGLTKTGGTTSSFGYDPLGTRTSKTVGGTTHKYLTDGSNPLVEQNSSGETAASVATSGLDQYLTRTENGQTQVYLTDALGTVVGLANQDGTIATRYTYDPYGQPTTSGTASTNPYTFTGREDDGTGLLYYRNRYYDPETGRFISQDPIGHAGGPNLYQYALSSPTTYTDPTGNNPLLAGCAVGALFDGALDWGIQRLSGRKVNWGQVGQAAAMGCAFGMLGAWGGLKWANRGCKNSFTADTPVLMADGTRKPIKDVKIGEQVLATDPETGESGPRKVTALIQGSGNKQLVDIMIDTDGASGTKTGNVTATDGHPFWLPELQRWVPAGEVESGQWLLDISGARKEVKAAQHRSERNEVYNLTVYGLHTYYVVAGRTPILVHNACGPVSNSKPDELSLELLEAEFAGVSRIPAGTQGFKDATSKGGNYLWAVGEDGVLNMVPALKGIHHTAATGGNPVMAAGQVTFRPGGAISSFDNMTGHYTPCPECAKNFIQRGVDVFAEAGIRVPLGVIRDYGGRAP